MAMILLSPMVVETLSEYLKAHENDIALQIDDFGLLSVIFIDLFHREAVSNE
jgi:hypothetical protein